MTASNTRHRFSLALNDLARVLGMSFQSLSDWIERRHYPLLSVRGKLWVPRASVRAIISDLAGPRWAYPREPKVISFQMLKGGVSKTTSALNIGVRTHMFGCRVLWLDLDAQANLSFALGVTDPDVPVFADILKGHKTLAQSLVPIAEGADLLPSSLENSLLDRLLVEGRRNLVNVLAQVLAPVRANYDWIVIDTAPSLSAINTAVTCASDTVVLPMTPDRFAWVGLLKTLADLDRVRSEFGAHAESRALFTRFDGRESSGRELLRAAHELLKERLIPFAVRSSTEAKNVIGSQRSIFELATAGGISEDYDLVTRSLLGWPTESLTEDEVIKKPKEVDQCQELKM